MGKCKYCGHDAGLLKNVHAQCQKEYHARQAAADLLCAQIGVMAIDALKAGSSIDALERRIDELTRSATVSAAQLKQTLAQAWIATVDHYLEDGLLDNAEDERLSHFQKTFGLTQDDLNVDGAYLRVAKAATLREVLSGNIPTNVELVGQLPINLQKDEQVVWAFPSAAYLEDKSRRQYVGGAHGASVRVMKGVYYRVGSFRGEPITTTERVHVDTGLVLITSSNIYFAGPQKSLRVPYAKILTFQPFTDGVGIVRDAANAKAQIFVTGDGWFTYNLVANLAQL